MSRGNAEQPSAQTPKGPGSPNRVETAVQGRPENGPQGRPEAAVQNGPQRGIQDRQQPGPQGNPQARNPQEGGKGDSKGAGPQGGGAQGGGPQGGNPQGRGPQGGSPQAGGPQGGSAQSGNPQARVGGPQARSEQPNAQQPPQRTPDVKTPGPQQPSGGPSDRKPTAGPVAGATGKPPDGEHKSSNGQTAREEQVAATRTGGAAAARGGGGPQGSGAAVRPPQPGGPRPAGPASGGTAQPKQASNQQAPNQQAQATKQPPTKAAGQGATAVAPTQPRPTTSSSPAGPSAPTTRPETAGAIPVWDPPAPPPPKQSLLARLGFGKKTEQVESDSAAPPVQQAPTPQTSTTQPPSQQPATSKPMTSPPAGAQPRPPQQAGVEAAATGGRAPQARTPQQQQPGTQPSRPGGGQGTSANQGAAAGLTAAAATAAATTQARQQAPAQPGISQSPVRAGDNTGGTPRVAGNAPPTMAPPVPGQPTTAPPVPGQARVPTSPPSGAPGPFPMPAPVQALREAATQNNPVVAAAPEVTDTPEDHHGAKSKVGVARRTRKARLRLSRLDPWSVMKTSFLFSIAAGIMLVVAVYVDLDRAEYVSGCSTRSTKSSRSVVSTPGDTTPFRIQEYINTQKVMGVDGLDRLRRRGDLHRARHPGLVPLQPGRHHARRPGDHPRRGLTRRTVCRRGPLRPVSRSCRVSGTNVHVRSGCATQFATLYGVRNVCRARTRDRVRANQGVRWQGSIPLRGGSRTDLRRSLRIR